MGMSYWQWTWRLMFKLTNLTCLRSNHVSCKFCFVVDFPLTCLSQALCTMANLYMFSVIYHTLKCFFFMFQSGEHLKPFSSQYWRDYCLPLVLDLYLTLPNMGCTLVFEGSPWDFFFFVLFFDPGPEEMQWVGLKEYKMPSCIIGSLFICHLYNELQSMNSKIKILMLWFLWIYLCEILKMLPNHNWPFDLTSEWSWKDKVLTEIILICKIILLYNVQKMPINKSSCKISQDFSVLLIHNKKYAMLFLYLIAFTVCMFFTVLHLVKVEK